MIQSENALPRVSSALEVQGRVISALILREVHTLYGNTKLGYLWALLHTSFNLFLFWTIRVMLHAQSPGGMSMMTFLLSGFIPFYIFQDTCSRCMAAVSGNQALLTFSQVTELDLMIARMIVVWGTQIICGIILLALGVMMGERCTLYNPSSLIATFLCAPILGLGGGLVFASTARLFPIVEKVEPFIMRVMFFISGVFFTPAALPKDIAAILMLNPAAQIVEWQRYGFSRTTTAPLYSISYIAAWCLGTLCVGLLLERYVRGRVLQ